jgi:hypothetical protein
MTERQQAFNPFAKDAEFDKHVKSTMGDVVRTGEGVFVQLDAYMTMFLIMPRAEADHPLDFFVPVYMHHGLSETREDGKKHQTSRICLEASDLGPCALCDVVRLLSASKNADDQALVKRLSPRKRVYVNVWKIPLAMQVGRPTGGDNTFSLVDFDGKPRTYNVTDDPSMGVLGLPKGVWDNLVIKLRTSGGVEKFIGANAYPMYVIGNGKEGLARRYKEPNPLLISIPEGLRPPDGTPLLNITETVEFPTPYGVAMLVDENFPGLITDFSPYAEQTEAPAAAPAPNTDETDGFAG